MLDLLKRKQKQAIAVCALVQQHGEATVSEARCRGKQETNTPTHPTQQGVRVRRGGVCCCLGEVGERVSGISSMSLWETALTAPSCVKVSLYDGFALATPAP
jgi:hypothetical protein